MYLEQRRSLLFCLWRHSYVVTWIITLLLLQTVGVADLVNLEPLSEDAIIDNLHTRFKHDQIYVSFFPFYVRYSTLLHLPPLRFHCVGGFWDRTQGLLRRWHWQPDALTMHSISQKNNKKSLFRFTSLLGSKSFSDFVSSRDEQYCSSIGAAWRWILNCIRH